MFPFAFLTKLFKKKEKKIKLGLALGSGGAKGFAHMGALKAFEEEGISFDIIAGASIGSIVGGFYAQGYTSDEILHLMDTVSVSDIIKVLPVMMNTDLLEGVIDKYIGDLTFEELKKPFTAVITDRYTGEEVDVNTGSVAKALCASSSYPPFFKPVVINGKEYIDGAFSNSVPADVVKNAGADYVIGIDLSAFTKNASKNVLTKVKFSYGDTSVKGYKYSNVMLMPDLTGYTSTSFTSGAEIYDIGYHTAKAMMPKIKKDIEGLKNGKKKEN